MINRLDFGVDTGHDAELAAKDERADGGKYPSAETSMRMQLSGHITSVFHMRLVVWLCSCVVVWLCGCACVSLYRTSCVLFLFLCK